MSQDKLRRRIAWEAARLIYFREETEYQRARTKAARRICRGEAPLGDLPTNREIREQIEAVARAFEGERRGVEVGEMRLEALRIMQILKEYQPYLVGGTLTGHARRGSPIDIHIFSDSVEAVQDTLQKSHIPFEIVNRPGETAGSEKSCVCFHVTSRFVCRLTLYPAAMVGQLPINVTTGQPIQRANIGELERLIAREHPALVYRTCPQEEPALVDRFLAYESLLVPLEHIRDDRKGQPDIDLLTHSLQVFHLARSESPYDEEFLLAALLHDVGKAIDPKDHVAAALEALDGYITERTAWLIAHHMEGLQVLDGSIGQRARRRLESSEDYDLLVLLARCDRAGRQVGVAVPDLEDAIEYLRALDRDFG
ncbi:MAG TPA: HD domain-containing protein [Thermogutta sp.]|nr:HD domain-containing protein [Thermogutta sp.]